MKNQNLIRSQRCKENFPDECGRELNAHEDLRDMHVWSGEDGWVEVVVAMMRISSCSNLHSVAAAWLMGIGGCLLKRDVSSE